MVLWPGLPVAAETPRSPTNLDIAEAESWAEETFTRAIEGNRISGAVISLVKDGAIVFERGYGLDDVLTGEPADPNTTRVRIGSTTKTFTATLLAGLVQDGRIASLDDPVNQYSERIQLPANHGVPITFRHLLTHTAGFEDRFFHIGSFTPVALPASPQMIESLRPDYARPAGERVVYSNFGVALLGWIIEDITDTPIDRYMAEQLFDPLGMKETELAASIVEPEGLAVPGVLDADVTMGPTPFTAINPAVAQTGSIVSTAHDMALYMNAQLGEVSLLATPIIQMLQTPLAGNAPGISQLGMVYFVDEWAGQRMVSHGGNWAGFHTWMLLLPDQRAGLFITLLSEARPNGVLDRFLAATWPALARPASPAALSALSFVIDFMVRFFGSKRGLDDVTAADPEMLAGYAGLYRADRRPFSTLEALSSLVYFGGETMEVTAGADGLYVGGAGPWLPEGGGRFILDTPARPRMVFSSVPGDGRMMATPDIGIYTFTRISTLGDPRWQAIAAHLLLPLTLLGLLALRDLRRNPLRWPSFLVGLCAVVMLICAIALPRPGDTIMTGYFAGQPLRVVIFALAANLQLLASLATLVPALNPSRKCSGRAYSIVLAVLGLALALVLAQFNVIGLHRI
ncbi:MAG: serine hydrolase domain-containing protein [Xanthomonadales bacterium]|jgi:CubicO group peptidase (beta-lactamase class C family)|nr:serine hydrolase domain-containing protein [Xanthomonadales bacterium]